MKTFITEDQSRVYSYDQKMYRFNVKVMLTFFYFIFNGVVHFQFFASGSTVSTIKTFCKTSAVTRQLMIYSPLASLFYIPGSMRFFLIPETEISAEMTPF